MLPGIPRQVFVPEDLAGEVEVHRLASHGSASDTCANENVPKASPFVGLDLGPFRAGYESATSPEVSWW
jgi:hypothetical protein